MPLFETPGWSLSPALLKTQAEQPVAANVTTAAMPSRKRKRKNKSGQEVSEDNVADLWRQHVEGIMPTSKSDAPKKDEGVAEKIETATVAKQSNQKRKSGETESAHEGPKKKRQNKDTKQIKEDGMVASASVSDSAANARTKSLKSTTAPKPDVSLPLPPPPPPAKPEVKLTPLQAAMRQKLVSARFRHLNETLYTTPSTQAQALLQANPIFFNEYHSGFRQQVQAWPQNPLDGFVQDLQDRGKIRINKKFGKEVNKTPVGEEAKALAPLPRTDGTCIVADLGCGDAKLASTITGKIGRKMHIKVLSYDLQSPNALVTAADIAKLPLTDGSIDVAIFCLALMGTNWIDFIEEAWRVLHWKGELWVAEIKSRFGRPVKKVVEHSVGNRKKKQPTKAENQKQKQDDERVENEHLMVEVDGADSKVQTDVTAFVEVLRKRGFVLQAERAIDMSNKMFVKMRFLKAAPPTTGRNVRNEGAHSQQKQKLGVLDKSKKVEEEDVDETSVLKPCLYKLR